MKYVQENEITLKDFDGHSSMYMYTMTDNDIVSYSFASNEIEHKLMYDLLHKKIDGCTYIKSIRKLNEYNGFCKITVFYMNGVKSVYRIKTNE